MQQMQYNQGQIQQACKAGVQLLTDKDMKVPAQMAVSGELTVLVQVLTALAQGELVAMNAPKEPQTNKSGEQEPPTPPDLTGLQGGKKD